MTSKFTLLLKSLVAFVIVLNLNACKPDEGTDDNQPTESISQSLTSSGKFSMFISAIDRAGLSGSLSSTASNYTLLAVSDLLLQDNGIDFTAMTDDEVKSFVKLHLIAGKKNPSDFTNKGYVSSEANEGLNGEKLSIYTEVVNETPYFNGLASFNKFDATNGVIYELEKNLRPLTLLETIQTNPNLKNYYSGIILDGAIKTQLSLETDNTVFAINETELVEFLKTQSQITMGGLSASMRRSILNNTMIYDETVASSGLTGTITTEGDDMVATNSGGSIKINGTIDVIQQDIYSTNGVIHIINGVILQ
ncbi:MAG: fasciclin domain-containing protein [Flavobacteriales bacterium]|nr:fasciclin domain-containing protein [Flavobacteriales bacterium]